MTKKAGYRILVAGLLAMILALTQPREQALAATNTSGSFDERIAQLQSKFPGGRYWNHVGSAANNPDGVTSTPCTHHGGCSRNGYNGWCGCNSFGGQSIQCFGFAEKLAYDVFGTNPTRSWTKSYSLSSVRAGDIIRYKNNGHSIFVTKVSGNTITFADCNSDGHCRIRWNVSIAKSAIYGFNYVWHADNYDQIMSIRSDRTAPVIRDARIESTDAKGYTIAATVTDDVAVGRVTCATWTERNGQDDIRWREMTVNGSTARLFVPYDGHNDEVDYYNNHIYAYDTAGNYTAAVQGYSRCEDMGTDFFAKLTNPELNRVICSRDGKAVSGANGTRAESVWKFERQSDLSYKITSCLNGGVLDVSNGETGNRTPVLTYSSNNGSNQRWYFCKNGNGYSLMPACAHGMALDIFGKSLEDGAEVVIHTLADRDGAEIFRLDKVTDLSACAASLKRPRLCSDENLTRETTEYRPGEHVYFQLEGKNIVCVWIKVYRNGSLELETTMPEAVIRYPNVQKGNYVMQITPANGLGAGDTVTLEFVVKEEDRSGGGQNPGAGQKPAEPQQSPAEPQQKPAEPQQSPAGQGETVPGVDGLRVTGQTEKTVSIAWNAVRGADGYELVRYKGSAKKPEKTIAVSGSASACTDKKLKAGTVYRYKVRAYHVSGQKKHYGAYSQVMITASSPASPKIRTMKFQAGKRVEILWKKAGGADGYEVYRSDKKSGAYKKIASIGKNRAVNCYTDKKLTRKKTYYYKVRAYKTVEGKKIYSSWSAVKKVKM